MNIQVKLPSGKTLAIPPPAAPLSTEAKLGILRGHMDLLVWMLDYTRGGCEHDEPVSNILRPDYLELLRNALEMTK